MSRPIGVICSNTSGLAVAERIAATGRRVLLHMTDVTHLGRLPKNIEAAPTPTDIGFDCTVVFSFIDDSTAFRTLLLGTPDRMGLGAELNPGAVIVDFGARPPRETQALLAITGMRGVAIVDAALTSPASALTSGNARILAGGYPDALDEVEPVLALLGTVDRTGPLGSAHTAAALMGYMEAAHRVAHDEALAVGQALGLSAETLARVLDSDRPGTSNTGDGLTGDAANIVTLTHRTGLALKLATDRGVSADVIDFTGARLAQNGSIHR
jgi:3-hydroxyisobutyrate dehydrogenase